MYSRLRILYLILLVSALLAFIIFFFQNLHASLLTFLHFQNFLPVAFGLFFAFILGIFVALFSHLFISASREAMFYEGSDSSFKEEEL